MKKLVMLIVMFLRGILANIKKTKVLFLNNKKKILVILSAILFSSVIFYIINQSKTQNCIAQLSINAPVEDTLLRTLSLLGGKDTETFDREAANMLGSRFKLSGSYRLLIKADKPSATTTNGIMEMKNLYQVGCFKLISGSIAESLKYPLFEALNADIEFHKSSKMSSYGLDFDIAQLEVFQGKCNFLTVVDDGEFEIGSDVYISQKGYMQIMSTVSSSNGKPIIVDIDFPPDSIVKPMLIICTVNPDFSISGYTTDDIEISSPIYEGAFLNPRDFYFIAFYAGPDTEAFIHTTKEEKSITYSMDVSNSSINFISNSSCKLSIKRCEGILNIMDTPFPLKNRSDLSNVDFYFDSIKNIDVRFKTIDENNVSIIISIDGKTNKVILDGEKLGVYSIANIYKMITSDYLISTIFSSSVAGFFAAFFIFVFEKRKKQAQR